MKPYWIFPEADPKTMWIAGIVLGGLLILSVSLELLRQRRARRRRLAKAWKNVREIAKEKGLADEEWRLLQRLIQQCNPHHPVRTITVRRHFEKSVELFMDALQRAGDAEGFEHTGRVLRDVRGLLGLDYMPLGQRIRTTRELSEGQVLWIRSGAQADARWVRCTVAEMTEAHLGVALPANGADWVPSLREGERVECRLWREEDARYAFTTKFTRRDPDVAVAFLLHTSSLKRTQSREYYRVRYDQGTQLGILNAPVDGDYSDAGQRQPITHIRGRITSLSAGGMAVVVQQPMPKQVLLRVRLKLPHEEPVDVEARIVSTSALSNGRHLIRAAYVAMGESTRDKIAHYVLQRQQPHPQESEDENETG